MKHHLSSLTLCSLLACVFVCLLLRILAMTSSPLGEKLSLGEMKTNTSL